MMNFKSPPFKGVIRLPPWITTNLTQASFKLLSRSWIASWAAFLLLIPSHSLNTFGNAAFLACVSSLLVPPAYPVQIFFYGMAFMVLGSLIGWAWGCAAMKIALMVRDQPVLLSQLTRAQHTAAAAANPDAMFRLEVFQGSFLDARSSVIYGIFLAVGCFFFAISRAYSQNFALFSVFGTIFLDIICSYGPLFPAANYMILKSFMISAAAYIAIGCGAIVLFFPESLNYQMVDGLSKLLVALRQLMEIQEHVLSVADVDDLNLNSALASRIKAMTAGTFCGMQKLTAGTPMLSVEFSFGRFSGEDIKDLMEPLTILISRMTGLQNFSKLVGNDMSPPTSKSPQPSSSSVDLLSIPNEPISSGDGYVLRHLRAGKLSPHTTAATETIRPQDVLPLLHTATADLRSACTEALRAAVAFIVHVNTSRWRRSTDSAPELDAPLDTLRMAIDTFTETRRLEIVEPFVDLGPLETDERTLPRRALFYAFVFQANLCWCADAIVQLLEVLAEKAEKRPRARLWAPKSMHSVWMVLTMRERNKGAALDEGTSSVDWATDSQVQKDDKRDPDSGPPTNVVQKICNSIYKIYKWCTTPEAIYAFKYSFLSIALWLPGVFRTSAYINYVDKGIWALITAQTTLEPFLADHIYSFFARLTATGVGIVIGLAAWYIGAGHSDGNPYGIAAIMGVLLVPLLFWRIFNPSIIPPIMCATSVVLVVGYSWIDAHLFLVGNPGVGWPVAWRRCLLVVIGSVASSIIMFIPPKSARKAVRLDNASMILELSRLYGMLISQWIMVEEGVAGGEKPALQHRRMSRWSKQFRADFSAAGAKLQGLKDKTNMAQWEGSIRGTWAVDKYMQLNEVEIEILLYLAQERAVSHLDPEWRMRLLHRTRFLNPNFIAEVMSVFTLVSRSLKTGEPLQETLPEHLTDRVFYHHSLIPHQPVHEGDAQTLRGDHWDQLRSPEFMAFATGVTAVYKILFLLDKLHEITKELCGEVEMQGFAKWKEAFEAR